MALPEIDYFEGCDTDAHAQAAYVTNATLTSRYPTQDTDHVKATDSNSGQESYHATDPTKSLTGTHIGQAWDATQIANQRVHIDLGSAKIINKVYYENGHSSGLYPEYGVKNFTLWGSNSATAFADLVYTHDTDWVQLTTSQATFDIHVSADQADPKYITVTNNVSYRYYAFKFADNWGNVNTIGLRRIELQEYPLQSYSEPTIKTQGSYSLKAVAAITDSLNKTLTKTFSPALYLSGVNTAKIDMHASRTGANVKLGLHNTKVPTAEYATGSNTLLSHFNVAKATSTTAATGQTITYVETADCTIAQPKFGAMSLVLDGNSDYVTVPDSDDWNFGTGDFTIDMWARIPSFPNNNLGLCGQYVDGSHRWAFYFDWQNAGTGVYKISFLEGVSIVLSTSNITFAVDTWYHLAVTRNGNAWNIYVNGVSLGSVTDTRTMPDIASALDIGYAVGVYFNGYIDEVRILKGTAINFANVTTELTPTINTADTYQTVSWDLSGVADADKNAIDKFIITPTNADAENTCYFDNFLTVVNVNVSITVLTLVLTPSAVTYKADYSVSAQTLTATANSVVLNSAYAVLAQALTSGIGNVVLESGYLVSAQALTSSVKSVVLQSSYAGVGGVLTLTLYGPTIIIDCAHPVTALSLVLVLYTGSCVGTANVYPVVNKIKSRIPTSAWVPDEPVVTGGCSLCGSYLYE
jgi:hypothetical protein